jgi:glutamate-5-semialdehyde dehydrogenase
MRNALSRAASGIRKEHMEFREACALVKGASRGLASLSDKERAAILLQYADSLEENSDGILQANALDCESAQENGMPRQMADRLALTKARISSIASAVREVASLPSPLGTVLDERTAESGIHIKKLSVPLGVIGIIYEARPNVTCDSIALAIKSGNAAILKGGKEAIRSNASLAGIFRETLQKMGHNPYYCHLIEDTGRETTELLLQASDTLDVLIPRGGAGLIRFVKESAKVPVIETGAGNCHCYVEETADLEMASSIVDNAKTQRPSVCNAIESLLVDEKIAPAFLPKAAKTLWAKGVELRCDEASLEILGNRAKPASEEDYATEFNDLILAVKCVSGVEEAIEHINRHSTKHSEAIVTRDSAKAEKFLNEVDSACVYWNASTRFTDGGVFGMGAEIGISTQKLHARGPMALRELTSYKYVIQGNGEIRK